MNGIWVRGKRESPCGKSCPDRKAGCHASCEKYRQFTEDRDSVRQKHHAEIMGERYFSEMEVFRKKRRAKK